VSAEVVCRFCHLEPDGDRRCFLDAKRTRCSNPPCVVAWQRELDAAIKRDRDYRKKVAEMRRKDEARRGKRRIFRRA
jgi:hypothetical protein